MVSRSCPSLGDLGIDVSRIIDVSRSPFRLGGVEDCGDVGLMAAGALSGSGSVGNACLCPVSFTDLRGVDIRASAGFAHFVHTICLSRSR